MKSVCHCSHVICTLFSIYSLYVFNSTWLFYQLLFQNTWRFMIQCIVVEMQPRFLYFVWIDSLPNTFGWWDCLLYNTSLIFCWHSYGHCYCSVFWSAALLYRSVYLPFWDSHILLVKWFCSVIWNTAEPTQAVLYIPVVGLYAQVPCASM